MHLNGHVEAVAKTMMQHLSYVGAAKLKKWRPRNETIVIEFGVNNFIIQYIGREPRERNEL
jgi:hypothetical protein